ncbi:8833_t:CDS:2 [Scutellospora calospora]|uniref:8833_t:CDS:1 n=1 Tax=Scutellospora calospora TaxID=85575 RepID=A0ACA9KAI1_9GLOM|nr:8833_t:CDS:2 [Scutellospora calospora]
MKYFRKIIAGITDNATSMVKALTNLGIIHIRCIAYTLQLSVMDSLKSEEVTKLIKPVATASATHWNSTFVLLERLLLLYKLVQLFTKKITQDVDQEIRNDGKRLNTLLLNESELLGLKELVILLEPFAHATSLMGSSTYPTLSLMLPTIATLQEYLFKIEPVLTSQVVRNEDPKIEEYLAAILDSKFKNLEFAPEKFEEIKKCLKQKMQALDESEILDEQPTIKLFSKLASFFNNAPIIKKITSPVDIELKTYFKLPQMILYDPNDPEYKTENLLSW